MDLASLIGVFGGILVMIYGIFDAAGIGGMSSFFDVPSVIITFGGAFMAVITTCSSMGDFISNLRSIALVFKVAKSNEQQTIKDIISLSNIARKEGLLALEEAANGIDDEFLKKGLLLIVDGTDAELVRSILETELMCIEERHKSKIGFWDTLGSMGPAWGMIGTLIGLVLMLNDMNDPSSIGPAMAVALVTTFYGSVLANWLCIPVSSKLKSNSGAEIMVKEVMVEGLLSIQAGENPRVIEEKLKSFLAPITRNSMSEEEGGEVNG